MERSVKYFTGGLKQVSVFRNLKEGVNELHSKFVLEPADNMFLKGYPLEAKTAPKN